MTPSVIEVMRGCAAALTNNSPRVFKRPDSSQRAAAVCSVVSIAALEILMAMAFLAVVFTRQRWRIPPVWLPLSLFIVATLISVADSGHVRGGWPQVTASAASTWAG